MARKPASKAPRQRATDNQARAKRKKSPVSSVSGVSRPLDDGSTSTSLRIMRAAERLFAARGIDGVSLREVAVTAGQANNTAVAYHFGSRDGLIDAIVERHTRPMQQRWVHELDLIERTGSRSLRVLVEMLVLPVVDKIDDPDGGFEWLALSAQLTVDPTRNITERPIVQTPAVLRLSGEMLQCVSLPPALVALRMERVTSLLLPSVYRWARLERSRTAPVSRATFVSDLVDVLVAAIGQPPSAQTGSALAAET